VDYVSIPPSSAYDRALQLAQDIAKNGGFSEYLFVYAVPITIFVAPLALRAAKLALSRAADLSLESGERVFFVPCTCVVTHQLPRS